MGIMNNYMSAEARFSTQYEVRESGCWEWVGALSHNGYADRIADRGKRYRPTHFALLHFKGIVVPPGHEADHLCKNPPCVNPDHLEVVTRAENERRKHDSPTCRRGHLWSDNTYIKPNGNRNCTACRNDAVRRWQQRQRE